MTADFVPELWAALQGWFTPAVLFVLLNLVIGTIAIASSSASSSAHVVDGDGRHPSAAGRVSRGTSFVLERVRRSFNAAPAEICRPGDIAAAGDHDFQRKPFSLPGSPFALGSLDRDLFVHPGADLDAMRGIASPLDQAAEEEAEEQQQGHFARSQSDAHPAVAGVVSERLLPAGIKKSASENSALGHFNFDDGTHDDIIVDSCSDDVKIDDDDDADNRNRGTVAGERGGPDVDARCDDFINRFRRQLELQRANSLARYKEMLHRGAAGAGPCAD